ncbi:hypothetical protein TWF694_000487 [Orbilia ellipsospora]|uniref:Uncharacterized protein n=1 Tax=Orbilia ellipsospora TaxID=2528407 RepID=A0AAV9XP40_9PEZI
MPYARRRHHGNTAVRTTRTKPSLLDRLTGRRSHVTTTTTRTTRSGRHHHGRHLRHREPVVVAAPVHHQQRRPSLSDKVSGALMKLKGTLTRRPGLKAAGTRRQRGTDGRGSRRRHYY